MEAIPTRHANTTGVQIGFVRALPCRLAASARHMTDSSSCGMCSSPDSWRHSLVECTMSRCTWALVDEELAQNLVTTTEPNTKQWLFTLMDSLSHALFVKLLDTLWAIWAARRKAIHESIFKVPNLFIASSIGSSMSWT